MKNVLIFTIMFIFLETISWVEKHGLFPHDPERNELRNLKFS